MINGKHNDNVKIAAIEQLEKIEPDQYNPDVLNRKIQALEKIVNSENQTEDIQIRALEALVRLIADEKNKIEKIVEIINGKHSDNVKIAAIKILEDIIPKKNSEINKPLITILRNIITKEKEDDTVKIEAIEQLYKIAYYSNNDQETEEEAILQLGINGLTSDSNAIQNKVIDHLNNITGNLTKMAAKGIDISKIIKTISSSSKKDKEYLLEEIHNNYFTELKPEKQSKNYRQEDISSTDELIAIYKNITKGLGEDSAWKYIDNLIQEKEEKLIANEKFTLVVADADGSIARLIIMGILAEKIVVKKDQENNFIDNITTLITLEDCILKQMPPNFEGYQKHTDIYVTITNIYKTLLFKTSQHDLIFLGDILFDRFTNNLKVLLNLINEMHNIGSIFIKGNHDDIRNIGVNKQFGWKCQDFTKGEFADMGNEAKKDDIRTFIKEKFVIAHHTKMKNSEDKEVDIVLTHAQILSGRKKDDKTDGCYYYLLKDKKLEGNAIAVTKQINDMKNDKTFYELETQSVFTDWRTKINDNEHGDYVIKSDNYLYCKMPQINMNNYGVDNKFLAFYTFEILDFAHIHGHDLEPKEDAKLVFCIEKNETLHVNSQNKKPYAIIVVPNNALKQIQ